MKIKTDKSFGQHFLKNPEVIQTICNQYNGLYQTILEVGPGPATLTKELVKKGKLLFLVEVDKRFETLLLGLKPTPTLFIQDALAFNPSPIKELSGSKTWLVSNLPYNISAPLLLRFINWENVKYMTLMFQKEVGEKTLDSEKINSLYCMVRSHFKAESLLKLKPGAFHPPPEVHSIVINFERHQSPLIPLQEMKSYESFLRLIFGQKRKQLVSLLKARYSKEDAIKLLRSESIPETIRAEDLKLETINKLYQRLERR